MITPDQLPIVNASLDIAYDYLEQSGQVESRETARRLIIESIATQLRTGERRPLMLANRAVESYQRTRTEHRSAGIARTALPEFSFP
ncbi:hypothetical protein [Bradyrhizobium commune]|uniref:Uncharacterized protein n=1 Tax=Bradyrhizobium commune TaxID=83627 RepID=A0A7S9GX87_9BRAD|nr:hypothetical protein [Bradyrhizobium commune]QPF89565.1 hypothetical protein IC761_24035 [Bradyrhizobium commune]